MWKIIGSTGQPLYCHQKFTVFGLHLIKPDMAQKKSSYEHRRESWGSAQRPNIERDLNWQRLTDNNLLTLKVKVVMVLQFQVK